MKKYVVIFLALLVLCACTFQQQLQYPERWQYIMCIKHATKDISISCMNSHSKRLSALSPKKQRKSSEFKFFSNFGKNGTIDTDISFIPQYTDKLNYITNEIVLEEGKSITDFNGFTITAKSDNLVISNGEKYYHIKEKHDWTDITSKGDFEYGGHIGTYVVSGWQNFLWNLDLRDSHIAEKDPADIKEHRYFKWCVSPIDGIPNQFEVYTEYWTNLAGPPSRMQHNWYKSTW